MIYLFKQWCLKIQTKLENLPQAGDIKKIQILKHTEKDHKLKKTWLFFLEIQMPKTALDSKYCLMKYEGEGIQSTQFQTAWMISTGGMSETD